jgi:regulator of replication initiation timing
VYDITEAEQAAFDLVQNLSEQSQEIRRELNGLQRLPYNSTEEERAEAQARREELQDRLQAAQEAEVGAQEAPEFLLYMLKSEANKAIADKLPGGSPVAILTLAEETIASLDSENGQRMTGLVHDIIFRVFTAMADPKINKARAWATATRYKALITAGIPEELAGQILVAEAGRPWPSLSNGSSKR